MKSLANIIVMVSIFFLGAGLSTDVPKEQVGLKIHASGFTNSPKEPIMGDLEEACSHLTDRNIKKKVYFNIYRQIPMLWSNKQVA